MNTRIALKTAVTGFVASLAVTLLIMLNIHGTGMAPFNVPPVMAFLITFGITAKPLALIMHFAYGIFWSFLFVMVLKRGMTIAKGLGMGILMWLIMMLIYSPIMGWGVAGFGAAHHALSADAALYLGNPVKYLVMTLVAHLIYGLIIGVGNTCWIRKCEDNTFYL